LGDLLVSLGKISPLQLARALSTQYSIPYLDLPVVPSNVMDVVPLDVQRRFRLVPIKIEQGTLTVAVADLSQLATEVLPLLKRHFANVKVYIAAGDEIDAVHAARSGHYENAPLPHLPQVAPVISPVSRPSPSPTAEDLFGSIDLDEVPAAAEEFELDLDLPDPPTTTSAPIPAPAPRSATAQPAEEEEPMFFAASVSGLRSVQPTVVTAEPTGEADDFFGSPVETLEPLEEDEALGEVEISEEEDAPFFASSSPSQAVRPMTDDAFVPGVPASSPSSLAQLMIEPEAPVAPIPQPMVVPAQPRISSSSGQRQPAAAPPAATPSASELPDWLKAGEGTADLGWTGALDHLAPSKLIVAVTRALIRRGLVSERDILDAAEPKK
jgi:Type II secretion system (T2SS), protein E, N-terminal domain